MTKYFQMSGTYGRYNYKNMFIVKTDVPKKQLEKWATIIAHYTDVSCKRISKEAAFATDLDILCGLNKNSMPDLYARVMNL